MGWRGVWCRGVIAMTMATVNLLLGLVSILFTLAVALGALAYAVEGIRGRGLPRRWNLLIAVVLASLAWGELTSIGQDFARASEPILLRYPADAGGLTAVAVWTLISVIAFIAGIGYLRDLLRPLHRLPAEWWPVFRGAYALALPPELDSITVRRSRARPKLVIQA
jgi:hypothetical protein